MGVFDLFGRTPRAKEEKTEKIYSPEREAAKKSGPVAVFDPTSYDDV